MRVYTLAIVATAALFPTVPAFSQGIEIGPGGGSRALFRAIVVCDIRTRQ
jgi:hypothetical protein